MPVDKTLSPIKPEERAVVVGAGASGEAAVRLLLAVGAKVRLVEKNEVHIHSGFARFLEASGVEVLTGPHSPEQFADAALVVVSPGVPLPALKPFLAASAALRADKNEPPLVGELGLALHFVKQPIIAVTGTSGKTTTVSLIAAMLEEAGKKVFLGGNIGTPLSLYVLGHDYADVLVLECSSFQLQTSPEIHPDVAVLLNLAENHLDQHSSMQEYVNAKLGIFANQAEKDLALIQPELQPLFAGRNFKAKVASFAPTLRFHRTNLVGAHNAANAEAAFMACQPFGVTEQQAAAAVAKFQPLRHRLEIVDTQNGVTYVNDSKGTTVEALRVALEGFATPVWLLAGGTFKGGDLLSLQDLLRKKVKGVALFGGSRKYFEEAWKGVVPITWDETLDAALASLQAKAGPGEVILLSPATSSYDQYSNYKERGDHFCKLVKEQA